MCNIFQANKSSFRMKMCRLPRLFISVAFCSIVSIKGVIGFTATPLASAQVVTHQSQGASRRYASTGASEDILETARKGQDADADADADDIFSDFVEFLKVTQRDIISQVEKMDGSGLRFSNDTWGVFSNDLTDENVLSGGITRVLQGGDVVEKGACSLTLIRRGVLSAERAAAIRARQDLSIQAGDVYSAAALSLVFHSRSPLIPTFRSDVRIFFVQSKDSTMAWFGGGADLTPYYLFDEDITLFHHLYRDLCENNPPDFSYQKLKTMCDDYFYLPARSEHRGTGGIFFDDMEASVESLKFVKSVAESWMPSWFPIVQKRRYEKFTDRQKQWQLLRRGRYLEFNLLYDRGVKFGLSNANPRVEGVMVSAPPVIAWEYNHKVEEGSEEARLVEILKHPREWTSQDAEED